MSDTTERDALVQALYQTLPGDSVRADAERIVIALTAWIEEREARLREDWRQEIKLAQAGILNTLDAESRPPERPVVGKGGTEAAREVESSLTPDGAASVQPSPTTVPPVAADPQAPWLLEAEITMQNVDSLFDKPPAPVAAGAGEPSLVAMRDDIVSAIHRAYPALSRGDCERRLEAYLRRRTEGR